MKLILITLILGVLIAVNAVGADEGKAAPEFKAKLTNGETFSLSQAPGKLILVHFWASWCEACKLEMPLFESYYKKHHDEGLKIIAVNIDGSKDDAKIKEEMTHYDFLWSFLKDSQFKGYGRIWRLPLTFVIDRKGILQKDGWVLDHTMTQSELEETLDPLLKAK